MGCERWSTRKTLTWIRDYHGPDGGDPHENKHRAATEALTLMDERDAAVALLREWTHEDTAFTWHSDEYPCADFCALCDAPYNQEIPPGQRHKEDCLCTTTRAFLATLAPAEGEG